jgi:hypothetical protein
VNGVRVSPGLRFLSSTDIRQPVERPGGARARSWRAVSLSCGWPRTTVKVLSEAASETELDARGAPSSKSIVAADCSEASRTEERTSLSRPGLVCGGHVRATRTQPARAVKAACFLRRMQATPSCGCKAHKITREAAFQ